MPARRIIGAVDEPRYPPKPRPGDRVAILSPSRGLPGILPLPYDLGIRRLREDFGLEPVEYPTTKQMGADPKERARDVNAAFADPSIRAVITTIRGDDQFRILPFLDREVIAANPKPVFGYSDNTNLLAYLWQSGVVGYYGSSVMYHLGRPVSLHPLSTASLRAALFTTGPYELSAAAESRSEGRDWADPATFDVEPVMRPVDGWSWHNADRVVEGISWGGCLDVLSWMAIADREIPSPDRLSGAVLVIETSEDMLSASQVAYILQGFGERGVLGQFAAVLVGRSYGALFGPPEQGVAYAAAQREAVLSMVGRYARGALVVFDVDFGHTDPQLIVPIGGRIRVDGIARRIFVTY
jgi:muramoyltetrapeptide carboxypeptidase LdcA involved in peptidoglycan recycling